MNHDRTHNRIPELDGMRGLAILLVLLWHYFAWPLFLGPFRPFNHPVASSMLAWLWSGVDLFFVLSGFHIGRILLEHRKAQNYFQVFYLRRATRIVPLYFLSLSLFVILFQLCSDTAVQHCLQLLGGSDSLRLLFAVPWSVWSYFTFSQNIFMSFAQDLGPDWLAITWSLAVEAQFYLLLPVIVRFAPVRLLPYLLLTGCLIAPLVRIWLMGIPAFALLPCRMDSLFLGALLAYLVRQTDFLDKVHRYRFVLSATFGVFLLAGLLWLDSGPFDPYNKSWLAVVWAGFLVMVLSGHSFIVRLLRVPWLIHLGLISYGVYLFHQPLNGLAHGFIRHSTPYDGSDPGVSLLALVVTLAIASILHRRIEFPLIRMGHRLTFKTPSDSPSGRQNDQKRFLGGI